MRVLFILAMSLPLAGCSGVTLVAPKTVPEWAIQPQADATAQARPQRVVERRAPRVVREAAQQTESVTDTPTHVQSAGLNRSVVHRKPTALNSDPTAYSAEWQAREDARDAQLKRSMDNICRGC